MLLDIGVCGLHTVNGAVKTTHAATGWEIFHVLRSIYSIFKNSPALLSILFFYARLNSYPFFIIFLDVH
jgi:hypothetical protein